VVLLFRVFLQPGHQFPQSQTPMGNTVFFRQGHFGKHPGEAAGQENGIIPKGPFRPPGRSQNFPGTDTFKKSTKYIVDNVEKLLSSLDEEWIEKICENFLRADRIFLYGAGRSGLVAKALAIRLVHLALQTYHTLKHRSKTSCNGLEALYHLMHVSLTVQYKN